MPSVVNFRRENTLNGLFKNCFIQMKDYFHRGLSELLINFTLIINRLKDFIDNAVEPFHGELQVLLYPFFVYVYLELLCNGHKVAGKILIPRFLYQFLRQILCVQNQKKVFIFALSVSFVNIFVYLFFASTTILWSVSRVIWRCNRIRCCSRDIATHVQ